MMRYVEPVLLIMLVLALTSCSLGTRAPFTITTNEEFPIRIKIDPGEVEDIGNYECTRTHSSTITLKVNCGGACPEERKYTTKEGHRFDCTLKGVEVPSG